MQTQEKTVLVEKSDVHVTFPEQTKWRSVVLITLNNLPFGRLWEVLAF